MFYPQISQIDGGVASSARAWRLVARLRRAKRNRNDLVRLAEEQSAKSA